MFFLVTLKKPVLAVKQNYFFSYFHKLKRNKSK